MTQEIVYSRTAGSSRRDSMKKVLNMMKVKRRRGDNEGDRRSLSSFGSRTSLSVSSSHLPMGVSLPVGVSLPPSPTRHATPILSHSVSAQHLSTSGSSIAVSRSFSLCPSEGYSVELVIFVLVVDLY